MTMEGLNGILKLDSIMVFTVSLPVIFFWFLFFYRRRKAIKCYLKYLFFFWYLIVIAILGLPLCLRHPVDCRSMWIYARLIAPCSWFLGIKWEFRHGSKLIPHNQSAVCIANHQSMYDIVGLLLIWKTFSMRCGTIARNLFFWFWPVGLAMWLGGIIFIKRKSGSEETKKYFNEVARQHFEKNEKLWVFVEGTRNKSTKQLLPFKKGAFIAAIQHQVPIQPFVFSPFYFIDFKNRKFDSGKIIVEIMDPIPTKGLTENDLDDLVAKAYTLMSKKYEELKDEIRKYTKNEVHFD